MQLSEIAAYCGCRHEGEVEIVGVSALTNAQTGDITFVSESKYLPLLADTAASAVILDETAPCPPQLACMRTPQPRLVFAQVLTLFERPYRPLGIHPTAVIAPDVVLGEGVAIGANVVIESGVSLGERVQIHAQTMIYPGVYIGSDSEIHSRVVLQDCSLGQGCIVRAGAVIGGAGFGYVPQADGTWYRMPQLGRVVLGDQVDVGCNSTIDRPAVGETRIGRGCKIDNLVHIGHGVTIGDHSIIVAQVGIAGGASLGHHCVIAGQVGIAGHVSVGDQVVAASRAGITSNVESGTTVAGFPHQIDSEWRRSMVAIRKLPETLKTLRRFEERLSTLEHSKENSDPA